MSKQYCDRLEKGYRPRDGGWEERGYQPGAGHQPGETNDTRGPVQQDRGTPPSGGSGVKPAEKAK